MRDIFSPYLKDYYHDLVKSKTDPKPKRLFYALPVHSQFVLLAFLIRPDVEMRSFLLNELGIDPDDGIESVLFVLRDPPWPSNEGDPRFWNARGLVQRFLDRLMQVSLAPISIKRRMPKSIWNKTSTEREYKYLYLKDVEALRSLVGEQSPNEFFRDLESTYVSDLIEKVQIRVRLKNNDSSVTFRELSEGEQQLLTVLGLLCFTADEESLFLLDEPDTHLNPHWSVDYISYLRKFVKAGSQREETSHILLTTHSPLAIAELVKEQVQILSRARETNITTASEPTFDPRGMGFAGLLTSDLFKLPSSLDRITQQALDTDTFLSRKDNLTEQETQRLKDAQKVLRHAEFRHSFRDPLMEEYSRARSELVESKSSCGDGLLEHPGSPMRRRVARKLLMKTIGISIDSEKEDKK
jgi:ABC-type multidrug transport system ATPase subunit